LIAILRAIPSTIAKARLRLNRPNSDTLSGMHKAALSRIERNRSSASRLRSSGAKPMPQRIASAGLFAGTAAPAMVTDPPLRRS
jgi:hypothetical protein